VKSPRPIALRLCLVLTAIVVWVAGCSKEGKVAKHLAEADRHFQNREFEKAKIEYINVLREQRTNGIAMLRLGKILLAQGQFSEAAGLVAWSRRSFPDDLEMRETFVEMLGAAGGETNRVRLLEEIDGLLQLDPANQKAVLTLAEASRTPEEVAELQRRLGEWRGKAGDRPVFKLVEAELRRRAGDTNGCEALIRAAIQSEPTNVTSQATLAAFLLSQRRVAEGEAALKQAAELAPPYSAIRERWGRYLFQVRRLDEARAVLDEINAKAPERVGAWVARAELAVAEKKLEDAERALAHAMAMAPNHAEALRVQAQVRLAQGKPAEATRDLEKVVQRQPDNARSHYQLAVSHLLNKDPVSAEAALEQAVQRDPGFAEAVLLLADLKLGHGEGEKSSAALRDLLRRDPGNERAYLQLIRTDRARGREDDALEVARVARERFPSNAVVPFQMGYILRQQKKPAEARTAFEASLALATNNLPAFEQLVALDVEAKDFEGALRRVQARSERSPQEPLLWLMKSEVHRAQGDLAQSEAALRKVLEIDPENLNAFMSLARLSLATGKQKEAAAELEKILQRRPNDVQALQMVGMVRAELGEYPAAREMYEKILKVQPGNPLALNNLADLLAERFNQVEDARQHALKARQIVPEDPSVADTLGWIEYRRGQYADALQLITEASVKLGEVPEVQYHLGMTHYMMGQEAPARAALQLAVGATKEFHGKSVARDYLAMLEVDSGKVDDGAIRALEQRRKEAPGDVIALTRLGTAYEVQGSYEKAQEALEAALKLNPQSVPVLSRLAGLYANRLNNPTKALQLARTARELAPADSEITLTLGKLAFAAGDQAWAYSLLQEGARRLTNRFDAPYALAWAAYSLGRVDESVRGMKTVAASAAAGDLAKSAAIFLEMAAISTNPAPSAADAARVQKVLEGEPDHGVALYAYGWIAEAQGQFANAAKAYERLLARFAGFNPRHAPARRPLFGTAG
jgi:tetratricopeptide (TPR) repeat protein